MVLVISFEVAESGADPSLNPSSTHCWIWVTVKDSNGNWKHVDYGNQ